MPLTGRALPVAIAGALAALVCLAPGPVTAQGRPFGDGPFHGPGYQLSATWESRAVPPLGVLVEPVDIRWSLDDTYLVTDRAVHRVQRFTKDGEAVAEYGRPGGGDGQLYEPSSATDDPAGEFLYVADTGNSRVAVFRRDGTFVANWPTDPPPLLVAPSPHGEIHVIDTRERYLITYNRAGKKVDEATLRSHQSGRSDVAYTAEGELIILIAGTPYKEGPLGEGWLMQLFGSGLGGVNHSGGPADEFVMIMVDGRAARIASREVLNGTPLGDEVVSIAWEDTNHVLAAVRAGPNRPAGIYRYDLERRPAAPTKRWGDPITVLGWIGRPLRVAGNDDSVYTLDEIARVQRFDREGVGLGQAVIPGLEELAPMEGGQLVVARTISSEFDARPGEKQPPSGHRRHLIERYGFDGPLTSGALAVAPPRLDWSFHWDERLGPTDPASSFAAIDVDGSTPQAVVLDSQRERMLLAAIDGSDRTWVDLPPQPWGIPAYTDVAADGGRIYVLHATQRRLLIFDSDGALVDSWDTPALAIRVESTPDGGVVFASATGWFWALDSGGRFASAWPAPELPAGADSTAMAVTDIHVDADGRMYAGDYDSPAIHVYEPGRGGAELPASGSVACTLNAEASVASGNIPPGVATGVEIALRPTCQGLTHGGRQPDFGLRDTVVKVDLDEAMALVPGSMTPPGVVAEGTISWVLDRVPVEGLVLGFQVVGAHPGPSRAFTTARLDYLDGWYNFGQQTLAGPEVEIGYPAPAPTRLFLPRLLAPGEALR